MINKRWLKSTISSTLPSATTHQPHIQYNYHIGTNISSSIPRGTAKSQNFTEIFRFTQELAQIIINGSEEQARDKFQVLQMIKDMWETGIQFYLKPISDNYQDEHANDDDDSDHETCNNSFHYDYNYEKDMPPSTSMDNDNNHSNVSSNHNSNASSSSSSFSSSTPSATSSPLEPLTFSSTPSATFSPPAIQDDTSVPVPSILIINRKNPILENNIMCKQVVRRGRPTNEQIEYKKNLLRQFLNSTLSNKTKIESILADQKLKKVVNEEDLLVTNLDPQILIFQDQLTEENIKFEQYFDHDALIQLKTTLLTIKSLSKNCPACQEVVKVDNSTAIGCNKCHVWFHLKCLKLKSAIKNWKCVSCAKA
jgi:hypothetical protein